MKKPRGRVDPRGSSEDEETVLEKLAPFSYAEDTSPHVLNGGVRRFVLRTYFLAVGVFLPFK